MTQLPTELMPGEFLDAKTIAKLRRDLEAQPVKDHPKLVTAFSMVVTIEQLMERVKQLRQPTAVAFDDAVNRTLQAYFPERWSLRDEAWALGADHSLFIKMLKIELGLKGEDA